jgi:hypothetical protein
MAQVRMHSPPARTVKRPSFRWARQKPITRGGGSDHDAGEPAVPATGATAGTPGTWTPPGSQPPATLVDLMSGVPNVVTASPATAWSAGQYVQTRTAGAPGEGTWTGSAWVGGRAPAFDPGTVTVDEVKSYILEHPDQLSEILAAERAGQNRTTLVAWLQALLDEQ